MKQELLSRLDPQLAQLLVAEHERQNHEISLIASENYAPLAVREAVASELMNKYAEGYPGKRYYAGCRIVDEVEQLAINRCRELFGAAHANVQPHAGSQANFAAYAALLKPGDTILAMSLAMGGHLTHGHTVNLSGMLYKIISYGVEKESGLLNYDEIERLAHEHKPKLIIAGASAYARVIDFDRCATIARSVGAYFMADIAHIAGLVAAGIHPSPVLVADVVTSTTHKTLQGPRGGLAMCAQQHQEVIDRAIMPGTQGGPFMNAIAGKAVCFYRALKPEFKLYQQQIVTNAQVLAQELITRGYSLVTGGTDNHMLIVDLRNKKITGRAAELALESAGIIASRSCIPYDPEKPWITSGIRFGTPAITARGMGIAQAQEIASFIDEAIVGAADQTKLAHIKDRVRELALDFPIP